MKLTPLARQLYEQIAGLTVVDAHEHLPSEQQYLQFEYSGLNLFAGGYIWHDLESAGLDPAFKATMRDGGFRPVDEWWPIIRPHWEQIKHASYARALRVTARDLFGLPDIDDTTIADRTAAVSAANRPGLYHRVLQEQCNIATSITCVDQASFPDDPGLRGITTPARPGRRRDWCQSRTTSPATTSWNAPPSTAAQAPCTARWPPGPGCEIARSRILNLQSRLRSRLVAEKHYELSPALFMSFLDPYNQYTCGYFAGTDDLDQAQENKLDLICRKLMLTPQDKVLDIGCGWGGFARFAAERYGCRVTGITISDQQLEYARQFCRGLPVTIVKSDYRDFAETGFDKVLVCGMIEHVGYRNYRHLMQVVHDSLRDGGLFLLHTIGRHTSGTTGDPWLTKYIFPNSMVPSAAQLTAAAERLFVLDDWHSFGAYYDPTLMAWHHNFAANWESIRRAYDDRFYRMWTYYLRMCAGIFRCNKKQLWQIVLARKRGAVAGYQSVR